jgi:diguanylate cyclase (GGDEF)-like protein
MAFASPETEDEYRQARYDEYRGFSLRVSLAAALLTLGLWLRDFANDPVGAHRTMPIRFLMAGGVLIYAIALWRRLRRGMALLAGYVAVVVIEFVVLLIWERLSGGYAAGLPGYMYIYLLTPLMVMPFTVAEALPLLAVIGVVPNLQVALGLAPGFPLLAFNVLVWPACAIVAFSLYEFDRVIRHLFVARQEVQQLALKDALTGVGNRRYFEERAKAALASARRRGARLALLMIDIDHFKAVNDRYGHAAGDAVLRALAGTLARSLRGGDVCGRLGGEEFAAVLPDESREGAAATAERLRAAVERLNVGSGGKEWIRFTVSVGVAAYPENGETLSALMKRADARLYHAKEGGRNRMVASG